MKRVPYYTCPFICKRHIYILGWKCEKSQTSFPDVEIHQEMAEAKCRNNIKITRIKALQNKKHCNKS